MFQDYLGFEASCLIAITRLPFEKSARDTNLAEASKNIQDAWQKNRSSSPPASSSLGQKMKPNVSDTPQIVAINPSGDPTEVLNILQHLTPIPDPSTLFVPKLPPDIKEKMFSVLSHVKDQVRTCLSNRFHSDIFSLLNLLDTFVSFKLQEAVRVKQDAIAEITDHVSALGFETSRLSRTSESSEERKDDRYREHFQRFESLCELFDNVCDRKLSPILDKFRDEISSTESDVQNRELDKLKVDAEKGLSKLSSLLQSESNSVPLKKLIASNCETHFNGSYRSTSLLDFLTSLTSASVTSAELKSAASNVQSALDALSNRPFICCKMYVFPLDDGVRLWHSEFCDLACHEISSVGQKLSLAFREAELHIIEAKILGKMDEILEKSGDAVLCRQIGTNVVKNIKVCGLTASEQQALLRFDEACLASHLKPQNQFHVLPGKKFGPQMTTGGSATVVKHFALQGLPLRSIPSPPSSFPSLKCGTPPATSKKQLGPALSLGSSQFYESFKIRIDVASCKKCLRWVTKIKENIFMHCDSIAEWLESLTETQMHHPDAEDSTILGDVQQAIRTLYDKTTVSVWIEKKEFSLLSSTFVEIHALQSAIEKYLPDLKVNEFEHQVHEALQQLYHSAQKEITAYFASSEFGGKVKIASFKTLLEWNQAFQSVESLEFLTRKIVQDFSKRIQTEVVQVCQRRFDGHGLCIFILKLLYLEDSLKGVKISGSFVVEECEKLLKLQTEEVIYAAGNEISAIDHDELQDVALKAMRTFPQFKSIYVRWFNSKASAKTFDTVLQQLEVKIPDGAPSKLSAESKEVLRTCYKKASEVFVSSMSPTMSKGASASTVDRILGAIRVAVQNHARDIKKSPGIFGRMFGQEAHFHDCRESVAQLLGNIFAAYSLLEGAAITDDKMNWFQPHPTQIACILMLLGIGSGVPKNQLAEVGTGEGKSIILGILGLFFALLGKKVHIVCYNSYLSSRDAAVFAKVFKFFSESSSDFATPEFCTISGLYERFVREGVLPNLRECVQKSAKNESFSSLSVHDKSNRVLLIDEVDVFFGQDFYGKLRSTGFEFVDSNSKGLVSYAFDKRESINSSTIDSSIPELMSTEYARNFQRTYPNLDLKRHLQQMLRDLNLDTFPVSGPMGAGHPHVIVKAHDDIGYVHAETSSVERYEYHGYKTYFAYLFRCRASREIDETKGSRSYGINITTGYQILSDLPQYCGILLGVSGTVSKLSPGDHEILKEFKFSRMIIVPSTFNKQPLVQDSSKGFSISFGSEADFFHDIIARIKDVRSQSNRPILVILKDSSTLNSFAQHFRRLLGSWTQPQQLNEETIDRDRPRLIASATHADAITLVTRSYGRGSDFVSFSRAVNDKGGVHVILTFLPELLSEMVQIKGRTCRQDNKGSFEEIYWKDDICNFGYVSADELDSFIADHSSIRDRQTFLYEKRNDHDRDRTDRMKKNLLDNRVFANRTMDMIESARNRHPREAIDIAYEWTFK